MTIRIRDILTEPASTTLVIVTDIWPSGTVAEGLIQIAKQLPDASSTRRCLGVAAEHVNDAWCRAPTSLVNVSGTDGPIIARH